MPCPCVFSSLHVFGRSLLLSMLRAVDGRMGFRILDLFLRYGWATYISPSCENRPDPDSSQQSNGAFRPETLFLHLIDPLGLGEHLQLEAAEANGPCAIPVGQPWDLGRAFSQIFLSFAKINPRLALFSFSPVDLLAGRAKSRPSARRTLPLYHHAALEWYCSLPAIQPASQKRYVYSFFFLSCFVIWKFQRKKNDVYGKGKKKIQKGEESHRMMMFATPRCNPQTTYHIKIGRAV